MTAKGRAHSPRGVALRIVVATAVMCLALIGVRAVAVPEGSSFRKPRSPNWVATWAVPPERITLPSAADRSFRMIVHPTTGGAAVRIRLSNAFGVAPVTLTSVSVARRTAGAAIDADMRTPLTFLGDSSVTIPVHGMAVSDAVPFHFAYGHDLAVSFYVTDISDPVTGHDVQAAGVTSYLSPSGGGDVTGDLSGNAFTETTSAKLYLMGVDAFVPRAQGTVVAFGDSITDGFGSTIDQYNTWPDVLAQRLHASGRRMGVVNAGISGNTVTPCYPAAPDLGDPAVARFDRDVLQFPNVRAVIIMEGGNDLRMCEAKTAADVIAGLQDLVTRAHAAGIKVLLGTYIPHVDRAGAAPEAVQANSGDTDRQRVNDWIRAQAGIVDAVVDFDRALRDANDPSRQDPRSGGTDGVHAGPPGLRIMGQLIPLTVL